MSSQTQSGGMGSTNYQVNIENHGLSVSDVKEIAKDVFERNFEQIAREANETARRRVEEIREEIACSLAAATKVKLDTFNEPDRQVALLEAQKAYVLSGDKDMKDVLVRLVTDLSKEGSRDLRAIVLEEAIKSVSTLTTSQLDILLSTYIARDVFFGSAQSVDALVKYYDAHLFSRVTSFNFTAGDLRHLEYTRCGKVVTFAGFSLANAIRSQYPGLFQMGRTEEELQAAVLPGNPTISVIRCFDDSTKFQFGYLNEVAIAKAAENNNWLPNQSAKINEFLVTGVMSEEKVKGLLISKDSRFNDWFTLMSGDVQKFELTSVGRALAHSHARIDVDISIWL